MSDYKMSQSKIQYKKIKIRLYLDFAEIGYPKRLEQSIHKRLITN